MTGRKIKRILAFVSVLVLTVCSVPLNTVTAYADDAVYTVELTAPGNKSPVDFTCTGSTSSGNIQNIFKNANGETIAEYLNKYYALPVSDYTSYISLPDASTAYKTLLESKIWTASWKTIASVGNFADTKHFAEKKIHISMDPDIYTVILTSDRGANPVAFRYKGESGAKIQDIFKNKSGITLKEYLKDKYLFSEDDYSTYLSFPDVASIVANTVNTEWKDFTWTAIMHQGQGSSLGYYFDTLHYNGYHTLHIKASVSDLYTIALKVPGQDDYIAFREKGTTDTGLYRDVFKNGSGVSVGDFLMKNYLINPTQYGDHLVMPHANTAYKTIVAQKLMNVSWATYNTMGALADQSDYKDYGLLHVTVSGSSSLTVSLAVPGKSDPVLFTMASDDTLSGPVQDLFRDSTGRTLGEYLSQEYGLAAEDLKTDILLPDSDSASAETLAGGMWTEQWTKARLTQSGSLIDTTHFASEGTIHMKLYLRRGADVTETDPGEHRKGDSLIIADINDPQPLELLSSSDVSGITTYENGKFIWYHFTGNTGALSVKYPLVGTYRGRTVGCNAVYTVTAPEGNTGPCSLRVAPNMFDGVIVSDASKTRVQLTFFYTDTGETVSLDGNSFITIGSLNGYPNENLHESVIVPDNGQTNEVCIPSESVGSNVATSYQYDITGYYGNDSEYLIMPLNNNFTDKRNGEDLYKNSVTFYQQDTMDFVLYTDRYDGSGSWFAFDSTSVFSQYPTDPLKTVTDNDETETESDTAQSGEILTYEINHPVHNRNTMGTFTDYQSMVMTDVLPSGVTFAPGSIRMLRILDGRMSDVTSEAGESSYDAASRTVKFTFAESFLAGMPLRGEIYRLQFKAGIDYSFASSSVSVVNTGTVSVNGDYYSAETNSVTTAASTGPEAVATPSEIEVTKDWAGSDTHPDSAEFGLYVLFDDGDSESLGSVKTADALNGWKVVWSGEEIASLSDADPNVERATASDATPSDATGSDAEEDGSLPDGTVSYEGNRMQMKLLNIKGYYVKEENIPDGWMETHTLTMNGTAAGYRFTNTKLPDPVSPENPGIPVNPGSNSGNSSGGGGGSTVSALKNVEIGTNVTPLDNASAVIYGINSDGTPDANAILDSGLPKTGEPNSSSVFMLTGLLLLLCAALLGAEKKKQ